jgi:D-hexose-6-phosphate mutarotase
VYDLNIHTKISFCFWFSHSDSFLDEHANEILFMSSQANYAKIRGGVPVVFPQFGPGTLPQHGFARESDDWV